MGSKRDFERGLELQRNEFDRLQSLFYDLADLVIDEQITYYERDGERFYNLSPVDVLRKARKAKADQERESFDALEASEKVDYLFEKLYGEK